MKNLTFSTIENHENYMISQNGHVININTRIFLKPILSGEKGYLRVSLSGKLISVHRLVCKAFTPNPKNKPYVNHIDGNKLNNSHLNLEWTTAKENDEHASKNGLKSKGENRPAHKLKDSDIPQIRKMILEKTSYRVIAEIYGVTKHTIYAIGIGRNWKHIK